MHFLKQSFIPVPASPSQKALGDCSMLIGGATMYLKPDEPWPTCATCSHPLVPLVQLNASSEATPAASRAFIPTPTPLAENHATMVQLFVCPKELCYCPSVGYSSDTCSWLVRIATVPLILPVDAPHLAEAKTKIERGPGFLPARVVEIWAAGKVETLDRECQGGQHDSDEFYAAHEPEPGLKLFGNTVRGNSSARMKDALDLGVTNFPVHAS
ncbi:hypothetical protein MSAN_00311400 [Mycena sanguinolenta]|uniref:Uncharacterized protein n=1 Tax=Mycena sanguinolenta TaxID=230812 RepID=A0A8H6ZBM9_9AGAR|nr:hypothetical protein MSAN_00311400 [Mycena sanguinolenta]